MVSQNMIFQSVSFGLAVIITFAIFILNDLVDSTGDLPNNSILTIKLESCVIVLIAYIIILVGVYNKSIRFQNTIDYLLSSSKNIEMKIKL